MDKARSWTDNKLKSMERDISRVYKLHPALLFAEKKLSEYMKSVKEQTQNEYDEYMRETDRDKKAKLKKIYADKVKKLTIESRMFKRIEDTYTTALAQANQSALDIVNGQMVDIYAMNYNQVASDCKKVGIKVE